MSATLFEELILAKPYFDREGLIVAEEDGNQIGFVHAGFGPTDDEKKIDPELGVTCLLLVRAHPEQDSIGAELLARGEAYLRSQGSKLIYAGGIQPLVPFYWGLYGGSEMPGILDSDAWTQKLFLAHGYRTIDQVTVFHRDLAGFRPVVDRRQMHLRRTMKVEVVIDPPYRTWWEACTQGAMNRMRYELRQGDDVVAWALFWDMQPLAAAWGINAQGLIRVEVAPDRQKQGMATYLLSEAIRELHQQGVTLIEAQAMEHNRSAVGLYRKLGFAPIDRGAVLRKE